MSITLKFAVFTSLLCAGLIAGLSFFVYHATHDELETSLGEKLASIAATAALGIDGNAHDGLRPTDENRDEVHQSEAFLKIRDYLRRVKEANGLREEIYTFRRKDNKLHYVVMTHERPFVDTYDIKDAMLPVFQDGKPAHSLIYTDENGMWLSGYGPIKDDQGQVVGLLAIDLNVAEVMALKAAKTRPLLYTAGLLSILAVGLSYLLARTVTRKINYLTEITERISLGKMDSPIQVSGSDEVARLAVSLERMRESLKIAAELIQ